MDPVLILLPTLGRGGSETKFSRVVQLLASRGRPVHSGYLNAPDTLAGEFSRAGPLTCFERRGKFSLSAVWRVADYVREHGIGTILTVNTYPVLYAWPAVRMNRGGTRCLASINTTRFPTVKERAAMSLYARILRRFDGLVFGCVAQQEEWLRNFRLEKVPSSIIYNGVDTGHFAPRPPEGAAPERVVVSVGQFRPEKGQHVLLEAFAALPESVRGGVRLRFAGGGAGLSAARELAASLGIADQVDFLGEVGDVRAALASAELFVLPSLSETFSNAALEAGAMGLPLVLSDVGGAGELLRNSGAGLTYEAGNSRALAAILSTLLSEPDQRRRMSVAARDRVTARFSMHAMVEAWDHLLFPGSSGEVPPARTSGGAP